MRNNAETEGSGLWFPPASQHGRVLLPRMPDGSLRTKFPWWRAVRGHLAITGRRLDAPAPPLRAEVSTAYGETGFQPSGLIFPSDGCWAITGRVGNAELTFITEVRVKK